MRGTCQRKPYRKLDFESWKFRRCLGRQCHFVRIKATKTSDYLYQVMPLSTNSITVLDIQRTLNYFIVKQNVESFLLSFQYNKLYNSSQYPIKISLLKLGRQKVYNT